MLDHVVELVDVLLEVRFLQLLFVGNVVGVVPAIPTNSTGVELAEAAIVRFDLISLAETITASAVGIAAPAIERRDEAGLDARFGFTVVLCERPSEKDGKK